MQRAVEVDVRGMQETEIGNVHPLRLPWIQVFRSAAIMQQELAIDNMRRQPAQS